MGDGAQQSALGAQSASLSAQEIMNRIRKLCAKDDLKGAESQLAQLQQLAETAVVAATDTATLSLKLGNPSVDHLLSGQAKLLYHPPRDEAAIARNRIKKKRRRAKLKAKEL